MADSNLAYKRKYSLSVAHPEQTIRTKTPSAVQGVYENPAGPVYIYPLKIDPALDSNPEYFDYVFTSNDAQVISELNMQANIVYEKDVISATPQQATITLYNVSKETDQHLKEEATVQLQAGYEKDGDDLPILFIGQISTKTTTKNGADIVTVLYCGDSYTLKKTFRHVETFPSSNTFRQNLERIFAIAASAGVPQGNLLPEDVAVPLRADYNLDKKSLKGWIIDGKFFEQVAKLCNAINYRSYTAKGRLFIEPRSFVARDVDVVEVNANNIKENLSQLTNSSTNFTTEKEQLNGVSFSTYLNGDISPEKTVKLVGVGDLSGQYEISSLRHVLDLEGSKWDTVVECKRQIIPS
jgi:hypothetical protein